MSLLFLVLIMCFIIFLFSLYLLARDDFVIVRRDISLDDIFNAAFLTGLITLLSARVFFVIFHPSANYLNPLVFLLFPYFPGLSSLGGIVGGVTFLIFYAKRHKMPIGRILDFFAVSFLVSVVPAYLGFFLIERPIEGVFIIELILFIILTIVTLFIFPRLYKLNVKDGSSALSIFIMTFLIFFIGKIVLVIKTKQFLFTPENILLAALIILFSGLLIKREIIVRLLKAR